jgi:uncharacterized protein (TIGR04255 family)
VPPVAIDPTREIYPNAPLQLVACEVAYALAPGVDIKAAQDDIYRRLSDTYPLPGPAPASVTVEVGPQGAITHQGPEGFRFLNFERTQSIAASSMSIVIESSRYSKFEAFLERIVEAVEALISVVRVAAAQRISLRYIDEVPLTALPGETFDGYFTDSVLAPGLDVPEVGPPTEFMTTSRFTAEPDTNIVMRTGVLRTPVVSAQGPLAIARPTEGPFFLIDIDSAWQAVTTPPRSFDPSVIADALCSLHAPVRALFEHSITDKLRDDVLRKEMPA